MSLVIIEDGEVFAITDPRIASAKTVNEARAESGHSPFADWHGIGECKLITDSMGRLALACQDGDDIYSVVAYEE